MSIANKLTYLNDTKGLLKEAINDVGGELTDESTFRSYAEALNGVYDKMPKITPPASNELVFQSLNGKMEKSYFGDTEQATSILPSEYTEVDYIESSGTQYIDTGRTSTPNTKFEMDYLSKKDNTTTFQNLLGAQNGTSRDRVYVLIGTSTPVQAQFPHSTDNALYMQNDGTFASRSKDTNVLWNQNTRNKVIFDLQNKSLTIGEYTSVSTATYEITNSDRNIFILARNDSTISSDNFANGKLYSFKWYESNVLTMNLIPCYRNSDNEVGLYDIVNNVFYTNQGTGTFTYGSTVTRPSPDYPMSINVVRGKQYVKFRDTLPKEYTRVDYIQGRNTQWIDTGMKGNQNISFQVDLAILGATYIGDYNDTSKALSLSSGNQFIGNQRRGDSVYNHTFETPSNRHFYENNLTGFYVDNILKYEWSNVPDFQTNYNFKIGKGNSTGSNFQLYNCKIYDSNVLVRNFIPCYRNSDNEVGLYDLVNDVFYENAGTGDFTYGSEISNTYELNLKSKNLFDKNNANLLDAFFNASTVRKLSSNENAKTLYIDCEANKTYTISKIPSSRFYVGYTNETPIIGSSVLGRTGGNDLTDTSLTITTGNDATNLVVFFYNSTTDTLTLQQLLDSIQIEEGSTATSYEPYFDYELCKINTSEDSIYKNKQDGKWYLEQQNEKAILDGTQTIDSINTSSTNTTRVGFKTIFQNTAKGGETSAKSAVCNRLNYRNVWGADQNGFYSPTNSKNLYIRILKSIIGTTESTINTWLSSNNLIIYAELVEPVITEITSPTLISQLEAIEAQRSIDGTNVITSECEEGLPVRIGVSALLKEVS